MRPAWKLEDAKTRFSELVRAAHEEGPQTVTVRGEASVVVVSVETFERLRPDRSEPSLHRLLSTSPLADLELGEQGLPMPVREVDP